MKQHTRSYGTEYPQQMGSHMLLLIAGYAWVLIFDLYNLALFQVVMSFDDA
jgi:hypothetical protein